MTKIYPTRPDHGDRFLRLWGEYHDRDRLAQYERILHTAQIVIGAVAGIGVALLIGSV